jgi:iron complex outermembrane receptor protein
VTGSVTGSVTVTDNLTVFGGHVRGFEEVAAAPATAANRGTAPSAIRTVQSDFGARLALGRNLNLVASAFSISKPYYNVDANSIYRELGASSSKGIELSLAGTLRPGLSIVAGPVFIDAAIAGDLVERGLIGSRPVGSVRRRSIANLDWRLAGGTSPLSFDLAVESFSSRIGNPSNRLSAPAREAFDLGLRYRFRVGGVQSLLRLQVANIFNAYGWQVTSNGAFQYTHSRRVLAELSFEH